MKLSAGICFLSGKSSFETILESANLARKYAKEHNITSGVVYIEKMRQTRDEQVLIATCLLYTSWSQKKEKNMDELQQELFKLQDLKYRNFHSKLMPGIDKETIIGIRTPVDVYKRQMCQLRIKKLWQCFVRRFLD